MVNVELYKLNKLFNAVQDAGKEWADGEHVRTYFSAVFYQHIYGMKHNFSGYISRDAMEGNKKSNTRDHFLSPRLVFRAMMDQARELLYNFEEFDKVVQLCQTTIETTRDQNNGAIKFSMDGTIPRINALTIEKYDNWGWYKQGQGFLTEYVNGQLIPQKFPLKHLVPDWLTDYELKYVK